MKKFVFQFASILKLRQQRQDEALRALAATQQALQAEIDRKSRLETELVASLTRRENLGSEGAIGISVFQLEEKFIAGTKQRIAQAEQAIFRARKVVEKAMKSFLVARRQTRTMEVLRDKAHDEFKRARAKKEMRDLDEFSIMRARLKEESA